MKLHNIVTRSDRTYRSDDQEVVTDHDLALTLDPIDDSPYQDGCAEDTDAQCCAQDLATTIRPSAILVHGGQQIWRTMLVEA
jgi:hypothetical protein